MDGRRLLTRADNYARHAISCIARGMSRNCSRVQYRALMTMLQVQSTTVGGRLHDARVLSGLTTRDLAPLVGVSQRTVSNWENGIGEPTASHLILWAQATGQTAAALLDGLTAVHGSEGWEFESLRAHPESLRCPCRDWHDRSECILGCSCNWCAPDMHDAFWSIVEPLAVTA